MSNSDYEKKYFDKVEQDLRSSVRVASSLFSYHKLLSIVLDEYDLAFNSKFFKYETK